MFEQMLLQTMIVMVDIFGIFRSLQSNAGRLSPIVVTWAISWGAGGWVAVGNWGGTSLAGTLQTLLHVGAAVASTLALAGLAAWSTVVRKAPWLNTVRVLINRNIIPANFYSALVLISIKCPTGGGGRTVSPFSHYVFSLFVSECGAPGFAFRIFHCCTLVIDNTVKSEWEDTTWPVVISSNSDALVYSSSSSRLIFARGEGRVIFCVIMN